MNLIEGAEAAKHGAKTIGVRPEHIDVSTTAGDVEGRRSASPSISAPTPSCMSTPTALGTLNVRADGEVAGAATATPIYLTPDPAKIHRFDADGKAMLSMTARRANRR